MIRQPDKGELLLLIACGQMSRVGFSIQVECLEPDLDQTSKGSRKRRMVRVMLPDGSVIDAMRGELEPADNTRAESES